MKVGSLLEDTFLVVFAWFCSVFDLIEGGLPGLCCCYFFCVMEVWVCTVFEWDLSRYNRMSCYCFLFRRTDRLGRCY